jgi:hypothetical protein
VSDCVVKIIESDPEDGIRRYFRLKRLGRGHYVTAPVYLGRQARQASCHKYHQPHKSSKYISITAFRSIEGISSQGRADDANDGG